MWDSVSEMSKLEILPIETQNNHTYDRYLSTIPIYIKTVLKREQYLSVKNEK